MSEKNRKLTLTLEPASGSITLFYAFVNKKKVIADEGTETCTWTGEIEDTETHIKIRVIGIDDAEYKLGIDLPGTANDQELTFQLNKGYHETEITL